MFETKWDPFLAMSNPISFWKKTCFFFLVWSLSMNSYSQLIHPFCAASQNLKKYDDYHDTVRGPFKNKTTAAVNHYKRSLNIK